jgi:hypothetical protein
MSTTHVPLISSGTAGPLGVLHLPRLWQKVSLEARGLLAEGYPGIGQGYDMMVISALGLDPAAVKQFIASQRPTYPQFEAWIKAQPGVKLDRETIEKSNAAVQGYNHTDATRQSILSESGISDDASAPRDAVNLNNLDDWHGFHQAVLR